MGLKLAIDFGTTNSVIARWDENRAAAAIEPRPPLTTLSDDTPPLVPSLLYVQDGSAARTIMGHAVSEQGFDHQRDNRLFRNFKRGILTAFETEPRTIDGTAWTDRSAAEHFLRGLLKALPEPAEDIEQLVLTAPIASFSSYPGWLSTVLTEIAPEKIHVVDESTAAALGYAITEPGTVVLVVDFGGGTLDLSLVQLPESKARTGGILRHLRRGGGTHHTARVIAKAGQIIGGSDVDQWLLAEVMRRTGQPIETLGSDYAAALTVCESAKIALSFRETASLEFTAGGEQYTIVMTRADLEGLLAANGFYRTLRQTVDRVMHIARRQGIFKEDIRHVLLVGGTSLMPAVRETLSVAFTDQAVHADKPFTAVAEGALQIAAGFGLDDYLTNSYGLRYADPVTGAVAYDEIIAEGTRYPTTDPISVELEASRQEQTALELIIGEMTLNDVAMVEVQYEGNQTVFVARGNGGGQRVIPLNMEHAPRIELSPPGVTGECRIRLDLRVNARRQLHATATDLRTGKTVLDDVCLLMLGRSAEPAQQGRSLMPPEGADLIAHITALKDEALAEIAGNTDTEHAAEITSGFEPALAGTPARGQQRLSLRRLGAMLNVLPPDAITLDAAAAMLRSDEFYVRYNAGKMLGRRGDRPARLVIAQAMRHASAPTRASAVRHLYGFTWHATRPLLAQALADPDRRVREAAVYALCDMQIAPAFQMATAVLHGESDELRAAAAWGLRACPSPEAVPVLEAVLLAEDPEVRVNAMEALGANGTAQALTVIQQGIEADPEGEVKYAAALSLLEIAGIGGLPIICDLIATTNGPAREAILRALFHATNYLKIDVATSSEAAALIDTLKLALDDAIPSTRMAAVWPLAWIHDPRTAAILLDAYEQEDDPVVRQHMERVCASLMSPAAAQMDTL